MSDLENFRGMKDEFFKADPHSPLTSEQKRSFKGLRYFPENPTLDLTVVVEPYPEQRSIQMQTTTGDLQTYLRYGFFRFMVEGQEVALTIYRSEYGYFLPFTDALAGEETYGAGRYLEPDLLPDGSFHVNFNMAYNPYCAYNELYSCPITPLENRIQVPIRAGEKKFKDHPIR
jgi:uncharacterized protein (DUF1684 family)